MWSIGFCIVIFLWGQRRRTCGGLASCFIFVCAGPGGGGSSAASAHYHSTTVTRQTGHRPGPAQPGSRGPDYVLDKGFL